MQCNSLLIFLSIWHLVKFCIQILMHVFSRISVVIYQSSSFFYKHLCPCVRVVFSRICPLFWRHVSTLWLNLQRFLPQIVAKCWRWHCTCFWGLWDTEGGPVPFRFFLARSLNAKGKAPSVGQFGVNRFFRRLSNVLHCMWRTGLVATSPTRWEAHLPWMNPRWMSPA